jgi:DNA-binding MarR family transcriptional regulator
MSKARPSKDQCQAMGMSCACHNLRRATRAVTQRFDAAFEPYGLKATQFTVLAVLCYSDGATVTELADALVLDQSTLSRNLGVLRRRALIRLVEGKDRRRREVRLTQAGRDLVAEAYPSWQRVQRDFERAFDAARFGDSLRFLRQITRVAQNGDARPA